MAHSSRTWRGARSPGSLKRVRSNARKHDFNQARKTETKTLVRKAVAIATGSQTDGAAAAVIEAVSALDKAAKNGTIHPNAAARRKSRLMLKVNAALGGEAIVAGARPTRATGRAAAAKAAKARVAASRATKSKGEPTAAGKARAALTRSTRETQDAQTVTPGADPKTPSRPAKAGAKPAGARAATAKASATKAKGATSAGSTAKTSSGSKTTARKSTKAE